jgi:hypothetical protein
VSSHIDVRGLWERTVFRRSDDTIDASSEVFWLQGPTFFADLRQPVDRPSFDGVAGLRDLRVDHFPWLAAQNAFAGTLELDGTAAWWHRTIDMQPPGALEDRARLQRIGEGLDEYGEESPYYERWERRSGSTEPCWGVKLTRRVDERRAFLVRVDDWLMFARARNGALPPGCTLAQALEAATTLEAKQDLLDFEVSLGRVAPGDRQWTIERSTLPFKAGKAWSIQRIEEAAGSCHIEMQDLDPMGHGILTTWCIVDADSPDAAVEF